MRALLAAVLLAPVAAHASETPRLTRWGAMPVHGWFQAEAGQDALWDQVGVTFPMSPDWAWVTSLEVSDTAIGAQAGVTFEFGFLDAKPVIGVEQRFGGAPVRLIPQMDLILEAVPLPVYIESRLRFATDTHFEADAVEWSNRTQILGKGVRWYRAAFGVQFEPAGTLGAGLQSFPFGPRATFEADQHVSFGLFAGWEPVKAARDNGLVPAHGVVGRATVDLAW